MTQPALNPLQDEDGKVEADSQLIPTNAGFTWRVPVEQDPRARTAASPEIVPLTPRRETQQTSDVLTKVQPSVSGETVQDTGAESNFGAQANGNVPRGRGGTGARGTVYAAANLVGTRRSPQNSARNGVVIGLLLGCVSMVLFHQVAVPASVQQLSVSAPAAESAFASLSSTESFQITVPSAKVYVLELGPYPTQQAADKVRKTVIRAGATASLLKDKQGYSLMLTGALESKGVKAVKAVTGIAVKPSTATLMWPAVSAPTSAVSSQAGATAVSKWLSATVSALLVETGAAANESPLRDATQAVQNQKLSFPPNSVWVTGSPPVALKQLNQEVTGALSFLQRKQRKRAEQLILDAWGTLASLSAEGRGLKG